MIDPPRWTTEDLDRERLSSIEAFRAERLREPLEQYLQAFDEARGVFEGFLAATDDLAGLDRATLEVLTNPRFRDAFRYLAGPVISADDLKTIAEASLSPKQLREDSAMVGRILSVIRDALDRRRFAWVPEEREPGSQERAAAVVASAALMANSKTATLRRSEGKASQERAVDQHLSTAGLLRVDRRTMPTLAQAPGPGEFCQESKLGERKADLIVRLWDGRLMPIECKVSNSAVNSVKRLNNDAAAKAEYWLDAFGRIQVVPVAVLSGVYKLHNLLNAQARGLVLFWAHDLGALTRWIERTRGAT